VDPRLPTENNKEARFVRGLEEPLKEIEVDQLRGLTII